ncbi:hypothetical protein D3C72_1377150 [compost metagenome]
MGSDGVVGVPEQVPPGGEDLWRPDDTGFEAEVLLEIPEHHLDTPPQPGEMQEGRDVHRCRAHPELHVIQAGVVPRLHQSHLQRGGAERRRHLDSLGVLPELRVPAIRLSGETCRQFIGSVLPPLVEGTFVGLHQTIPPQPAGPVDPVLGAPPNDLGGEVPPVEQQPLRFEARCDHLIEHLTKDLVLRHPGIGHPVPKTEKDDPRSVRPSQRNQILGVHGPLPALVEQHLGEG